MGEGRKKAKESRVVPQPKLNPGCATAFTESSCQGLTEIVRPENDRTGRGHEKLVNHGTLQTQSKRTYIANMRLSLLLRN